MSTGLVVYTSAAVNYLAKARVLADTVKSTSDVTFVLLLNDRLPLDFNIADEPFDHVWHPSDLITHEPIDSWLYRHNVMEQCTAVKGPALERIMDELDPALAIYLDPDVLVLHDLALVDELLGDDHIGLTPHITKPETSETGVEMTEMSVLKHGIYNLGFLAVRNTELGLTFARWWGERLRHHCYIDFDKGVFTDQRWCDIAPAAFDGVRILKHPGLNVASWNASGRDVRQTEDGAFTSDGEPLCFYHFSGVGPAGVHRMVRGRLASDKVGFAQLEAVYEQMLDDRGQQKVAGVPFGYDHYVNGDAIKQDDRVAYRRLAAADRDPHPFATTPDSWYDKRSRQRSSQATIPTIRNLDPEDFFDIEYYRFQLADSGSDSGGASLDHYRMFGWLQGFEPSPFFDSGHYLVQAEQLSMYRESPILGDFSPLDHYASVGFHQGISPAPYVDSVWYESAYLDVAVAIREGGVSCGYEHYLKAGAAERRNPGPDFSEAKYREANKDVAGALEGSNLTNGFEHFLRFGRHEHRRYVPLGGTP